MDFTAEVLEASEVEAVLAEEALAMEAEAGQAAEVDFPAVALQVIGN